MDGEEHRKYRNLVAKAFRASQLAALGRVARPAHHPPPARRDRAARSRRSRRVGDREISHAGHLRDRGRAARGRRSVRAVGRGDQHRSDGARARSRGQRGDGRVPRNRSCRRGATSRPATSSPISCTPRSTARCSPTASSTGSCDCLLPAGGETTFRVMGNALLALLTHPDDLARVYAESRSHPRGHRGDAALGDVGDDGQPRRDHRHRGLRVPDRGGFAGRRAHRFVEPRRDALGRRRRVEARPARAAPPRVRHRAAPVPRHAPRAAWSCGSGSTRSSTGSRTCASIPPRPTPR